MAPLPTKSEVAEMRELCQKAYDEAQLTTDSIERMRLIHKAFPFVVNGRPKGSSLRISWLEKYDSFSISDYGGFITLVPVAQVEDLLGAILLESFKAGAFRELITGKKPPSLTSPQVPKIEKKKLTLKDLNL